MLASEQSIVVKYFHEYAVLLASLLQPARASRAALTRPPGRCTLLNKKCSSCSLAHWHCSQLQLLLLQAASASASVLASCQESSRGYSRTRPWMQCLVGSLVESARERGLDQRHPFLLPQRVQGHGQRVDRGKVFGERRPFKLVQSHLQQPGFV